MNSRGDVTRRNFVKGGLAAFGAGCLLPAGARAADEWTASEVLADFDELYPRLREAHFDLFARRRRAEYDEQFRRMRRVFQQPMSPERVLVEFQRFMAFGRVAHAHVSAYWSPFTKYMAAGGRQFPLALKVVDGRAYVTANYSGRDDIAIGSELTRVNRQGFADLRRRLHAYLSADNDYLADTLLELDGAFAIWCELGERAEFEVEIRQPGAARRVMAIQAVTQGEISSRPAKSTVSNTDWNERSWTMLDAKTGYLRPGPFYNHGAAAEAMYDNTAFTQFIDAAFRGLNAADARRLIIDIRNNPGGDNSFSDLMISWVADKPFQFASDFRIKVSQATIDSNRKRVEADPSAVNSPSAKLAAAYAARKPGEVFSYGIPLAQPRTGERFTGKCLLLVNRYSYSNAVNVAALMQDYGFAKVLGEETADLATSYGAMEQFTLSRTGMSIGYPKALIIRPSGDRAARGVMPDVAIKSPLLESESDVVLEQALAMG
jgi:C-terminal processing protease CtpA/Prc